MVKPTSDFDHLWNYLSFNERKRLAPYMIEAHKLHVWQCKQIAIKAHKKHMADLDDLLKNLNDELQKYKKELN